ncbi:MAG TPA: PQQ-binding-like beta-propeller repeat protein [Gemmataceae bacterium]|jgi:WD40 repeat protein|nr:PQQ-binding-like beta-propeller repeat protein [Gemmataceae bacterium]
MKLAKVKDLKLPTAVLGLALGDGRLYAACMDGLMYAIDPAKDGAVPFAEKHDSFASGCVLLPDGKTLVSAGYDGQLLWHDTATKQCLRRVKAHSFWSWQLALSPDGRRVATVTGQYLAGGEKYEPAPWPEPTVKVLDAESGELVRSFAHGPPVQSVAFAPDNRHVAAANMMGEIGVWDVDSGQRTALITTPDFTSWGIIKSPHYCGGTYGLAFAPDGNSILACGMGPMTDPMAGNGKMTWQRWDWRSNPAKKLGQNADGGTGLMETLCFVPDGKCFIMAGRQAQGTWTTALFADDGKLLASLDTKSRVTRAVFAPDGKTLYLAAAVGQPQRRDGKWSDFGRVHVVNVVS